ncbi:hypothetical protein JWG39_11545 [Desulforhopalus vacuolatus]|nr:hypothetical protein [Desulforhopalus vacuolatus]
MLCRQGIPCLYGDGSNRNGDNNRPLPPRGDNAEITSPWVKITTTQATHNTQRRCRDKVCLVYTVTDNRSDDSNHNSDSNRNDDKNRNRNSNRSQ